jgi:hypothetical protein
MREIFLEWEIIVLFSYASVQMAICSFNCGSFNGVLGVYGRSCVLDIKSLTLYKSSDLKDKP